MDQPTRKAIIRNHIEPLITNSTAKVHECMGMIVIEDEWQIIPQEWLVDKLAQELGSKGYSVDVYKEGDTVIIEDKE